MSKRNGLIEKNLFSAVHFSKWLRVTASGLILLGATLNVGCVAARIGKHKPIELSAAESQQKKLKLQKNLMTSRHNHNHKPHQPNERENI